MRSDTHICFLKFQKSIIIYSKFSRNTSVDDTELEHDKAILVPESGECLKRVKWGGPTEAGAQ